ncbi:hypothetical protein AOQ84DRAFT_357186 [Glonium stellatum]|uniref:gamma-glutamylcyclotransferase n=1 Tax=Glonium stellatum TaxID=574774 RepID=A0A8E2EQ52_9PEZI|nr:hypothetical protein AOQ84DRAFT_357186 [Glonium stellatum]
MATEPKTLYFGYGSNLWLRQMRLRCPTSEYLGVARLRGYRWIINGRGYANVVESQADNETANSADVVYGLVYSLLPTDEARLDVNEGVPEAYTKETMAVDFWASDPSVDDGQVDVSKPPQDKEALVYIDRKRVTEDKPKKEYIYRMNMGIRDALDMGVPKKYVDGVMREFIPEEEEEKAGETKAVAMKQALNFVDEN